jgi:glycosyltransferase involved in cell wall biosynthesis
VKIAIIVRVLWPGGVQRIAFAETNGLLKLGHKVDLIFIRDTGRLHYPGDVPSRVLFDSSIRNRILGRIFKRITHIYSPQRGDDATIDIDLIRKAEKSLKGNYDIIYYFDEISAFFSRRNKKKYGHKVIVLIHEVYLDEGPFLQRFLQRRAIKSADLVLTNTKYNLEKIKYHGYDNVYELYPGLYINDEVPNFDSRTNIAISVTMWDFGRNPETLIEIASKLRTGKIIICGDWTDYNYMNKMRNIIKQMDLDEKIEITGPIDEEEMLNYYKDAKVALRFGYNEKGPGMGSLEALCWGIPLIINEGIGSREIIENNKSGFIVDESDPNMVANLIESLFKNKFLWEKISSESLKKSLSLSWDFHNRKLGELIDTLKGK